MITIIPAILAKTEEEYVDDIRKIEQADFFEGGWVHIDLTDNLFVQNKSIVLEVLKKNPTNLKKEAHLMVLKPMDFLDELIELGFERIIIHAESEDVEKCIDYITGRGLEVGLALRVETELEKVIDLLSKIDEILIMMVEIGFQGQPLVPESLEKIKESSRLRSNNNYKYKISADGHVDDSDAKRMVEAGVESLVVGSYFMKSDDLEEKLNKLWEAINQ